MSSRSVNRIMLLGNVGRDPAARVTPNGNPVVSFSLATNRRLSDAQGGGERTEWHRLTAWGRVAEFVRDHVRAGDRLYVEGRLEYGSYERNGVRIPTADVVVKEIVLLSPRQSEEIGT